MATILEFPAHCWEPSVTKPKSAGSARIFRFPSSRSKTKNLAGGMRPRSRQFQTADMETPASLAVAAGPPTALMTDSTEVSMTPYSSRSVNVSIVHGAGMAFPRPPGNNLAMSPTAKTLGKRLRDTRVALGVKAADICRAIDIDPNRWSQYENGSRKLTMVVAIRLCETYGLTLDWLYRGDPSGLPVRLHQKLSVGAA